MRRDGGVCSVDLFNVQRLHRRLTDIQIQASETETYGIQIIINVSKDLERSFIFRSILGLVVFLTNK